MFVLIGRTHATDNDKFETSHNKQQEYIEKFMEVCDYINKHCTENLTLDDVAEMAGFSKYHFSRLFKQFTSHSFYKYLNLRRIMFAEKMLINPETSVTEVALLSGFNSISAFIRMFKICKKCTPTEFRNMFEKRKN
jgi:AraC-like DNA-binding protein